MENGKIGVQHGTQVYLDEEVEIGLVHVIEGCGGNSAKIVLSMKGNSERDVTLSPGDRLTIGGQTLVLDHVNIGGTRRCRVQPGRTVLAGLVVGLRSWRGSR